MSLYVGTAFVFVSCVFVKQTLACSLKPHSYVNHLQLPPYDEHLVRKRMYCVLTIMILFTPSECTLCSSCTHTFADIKFQGQVTSDRLHLRAATVTQPARFSTYLMINIVYVFFI